MRDKLDLAFLLRVELVRLIPIYFYFLCTLDLF